MSLAETTDIVGDLRVPINTASQSHGSIHDDATASKLGFKGGTVAGSLHMDQFAPLAVPSAISAPASFCIQRRACGSPARPTARTGSRSTVAWRK